MTPSGPRGRRLLHVLLLLLILGAGSFLRFTQIDEVGPRLWDEGIYLQEARFFHSLVHAVWDSARLKVREMRTKENIWQRPEQIERIGQRLRGSPPVYGRLNHDVTLTLGMFLWGPDDPAVGSRISAFTGSLSILIFYLLARRLYGPDSALLATLIFSLMGYHVHYCRSTMAEATTLLFLMAAFAFYAASRDGRTHRSAPSLAAAAFFLGLAFTTHNRMLLIWGLFVLLEIHLAWRGDPEQSPYRVKRFSVLFFFFFLPLFGWEFLYYLALIACKHIGVVPSVPTYFEQVFVATGHSALWNYISKVWRPAGFLTFPYLLIQSSGLLVFLLLVAGTVLALRRRRFTDLLVCAWLLFPLVIYSLTTAGLSRVYTVLLPAAALLAGSLPSYLGGSASPGASAPRHRRTAYALVAIVVLAAVNGAYFGTLATRSRDGYAAAAASLDAQEVPAVVSTMVPVLRVYLGEDRVAEKPPPTVEALETLYRDGHTRYLVDYTRALYSLYQQERVDVMDAVAARVAPAQVFENPFVRNTLTLFEANLYFWDTLALRETLSERGLDEIRIYDLREFFPENRLAGRAVDVH